ncbi:MAG: bifunctional hydroxymethylpyrimidine kinase/phosphomethylpyrimidine kinase [Verrucomicrobiota bacterium]
MVKASSGPPTIVIHSLPAFGGAGLGVILPALGTQACPLPSVWLTATANYAESKRWAESAIAEKLDAQVNFLRGQGHIPDLFIGYLGEVSQAKSLDQWLSQWRGQLGKVWIDPISGDSGKAYVSADLVAAWSNLIKHADVLIPNSTEISLLSSAEEIDREAWIAKYTRKALIIETSAQSPSGNFGIGIHTDDDSYFVEVNWEPGHYSGTGDLFASYLIASIGQGWAWDAAVKRAAELVRKKIQKTRESGSYSLILP